MFQAGDKLGRFRLDREIGQGSHGVVYVATDTALDTQVAVKILHPWLTQDTAVRDRFKRELLLARRIAHPGVCRLFDLHEEGEAFFITMDYVEGQTLLNILKNEGRLKPARAVRVLRGVCQALAAAHAAGVIHRDLKPANVIVRAGEAPMILDFGTATASDVSRVTRPGTAVGSMRFIAPEVFTGVAPSIRTDIYSLGVVAYVALAGKLPYNAAAGAIEMLEMIRNQPPQRIDILQPDVSAHLADVIARSMEKNPDLRFASAMAFDEALAEVEAQLEQPPEVKPITADFSRWAPAAVIRESAGDSTVPPPGNPLENGPGETVVDLRAGLSLGTHTPSAVSGSGELPIVTGSVLEQKPTGLTEPKTDETPRPISMKTTEATVVTAPPDLAPVVEPAPAAEAPAPRVEATVRIHQADLEGAERAAVRSGPSRRVVIAAAVVGVVVIAGAIAVINAGGGAGTAAADAGAAPVVDAGGPVATPDAGAAVVAVASDAGAVEDHSADAGTGAEMVFDVDAGEPKALDHETKALHADRAIEEGIRQVRTAMQKKGILPADLPAIDGQLTKAHFFGMRGNHVDGERIVQSAKAAVDAQAVDRAFILKKLGRFNSAYDKSKRPDVADKVEPLARKALASMNAGQLDAANKNLNSAFALLGKSK